MNKRQQPVSVAILVFPETSASVVYGIYDLLASTGRDWGIIIDGEPGPDLIRPVIVAAQSKAVSVTNQVSIRPEFTLEQSRNYDIICIPEIALPPGEPLTDRFAIEIAWLRVCYLNGATLATACSGAMLLAEAGLLNGQEATTHWAWCDTLKRRYSNIKVREQRALVIAGEGQRLVMAGGGSSWLDLALYLIGRFIGIEEAMQVARLNLIDWHTIGQLPYARLVRTRQVDDAVIARCQEWIAEHYRDSAPVSAMVLLSGLAERTFKRRFQKVTGMPPLEYVHTLRVEEAKHMLETSEAPIETIAAEVGYEDAGFFSRLFRKKVNLTPAQYRKRFGAMRRALQFKGTGNG